MYCSSCDSNSNNGVNTFQVIKSFCLSHKVSVHVYLYCRKQICRYSAQVKSKPVTRITRLNSMEEEESRRTSTEEVEMKNIHDDDEKDDYYFEDPSNIGT